MLCQIAAACEGLLYTLPLLVGEEERDGAITFYRDAIIVIPGLVQPWAAGARWMRANRRFRYEGGKAMVIVPVGIRNRICGQGGNGVGPRLVIRNRIYIRWEVGAARYRVRPTSFRAGFDPARREGPFCALRFAGAKGITTF